MAEANKQKKSNKTGSKDIDSSATLADALAYISPQYRASVNEQVPKMEPPKSMVLSGRKWDIIYDKEASSSQSPNKSTTNGDSSKQKPKNSKGWTFVRIWRNATSPASRYTLSIHASVSECEEKDRLRNQSKSQSTKFLRLTNTTPLYTSLQ